ncbi:MAG: hypothetical protein PW788_07040 [Micavibrio sp.]|nr:hypothetical protein [Micavibrio sp.]
MQQQKTEWPFSEVPDTIVLVDRDVMSQKDQVHYVARIGHKKVWFFGPSETIDLKKVTPVRLIDMLGMDKTLASISRLPENWVARRGHGAGSWEFAPRTA